MPQRSCWKYQVLENWTNVTYECFRKMWRCVLQSFSEIIRFQNYKYFLGVRANYYVVCTKPHTISCKRIEVTHISCKLEKTKTFTSFSVLSLAGNNTLPKLAALYAVCILHGTFATIASFKVSSCNLTSLWTSWMASFNEIL